MYSALIKKSIPLYLGDTFSSVNLNQCTMRE